MSSNESLSPPAKRPKLETSSRDINGLSDADLVAIFKHLPPFHRLLNSEVCKRWLGVSRFAWLDVKHLDLSDISGENIAAIVKRCPNLQTIFAQHKTFRLKDLHALSRVPLVSVTLYECSCFVEFSLRPTVFGPQEKVCVAFAQVFSSALRDAAWQELTLRGLQLVIPFVERPTVRVTFPATFPTSLKRLQLSDLMGRFDHPDLCSSGGIFPDGWPPSIDNGSKCVDGHLAPSAGQRATPAISAAKEVVSRKDD